MKRPTEDLVELARSGDELAYEALFERASERLLLYIRLRLGAKLAERFDPLDVLQETYLHAHRSFGSFEAHGAGAFRAWLCGIADHRIRDMARHAGAQRRRAPGPQRSPSVIERIAERDTSVGAQVARREREQQLAAALNELDDPEREVLLLRYFQGLSLGEIAARQGVVESTALRQIRRACQRVGAKLLELLHE